MSEKNVATSQVEDITKEYAAGYSKKLAKALKQRAHSTVFAYEEEGDNKFATTTYFGLRAKKKYTANMVQKLVFAVDDLVERGFVKAFLRGFSRMELTKNECAVFVHPVLTEGGVKYAKDKYASFVLEEGGTPTKLQELK